MKLMKQEEVLEIIKQIISEQLEVDKNTITVEASLINDLGADSLDLVEMIMEGEERFDLDISDDDLEKINKVGDALNVIISIMEKSVELNKKQNMDLGGDIKTGISPQKQFLSIPGSDQD